MAVAIRTQQIGDGEQAIFLGPSVLVASKSDAGAWHCVENGQCDCKGFYYRGTCRHLGVARAAEEADRASALAVALEPQPEDDTITRGFLAGVREGLSAPETDVERLTRLQRTRDAWAARTGKHARQQELYYERLARNLEKQMAFQASSSGVVR